MTGRTLSKILLAGGLMIALAAGGCDSGGNAVGNNGNQAGNLGLGNNNNAGNVQDNFGAAFAAAFNADANDAPVDPGANDLGGVILNADPIDF